MCVCVCVYDYNILVLSKCSSSITVGRGFLEHCSVDLVASNLLSKVQEMLSLLCEDLLAE